MTEEPIDRSAIARALVAMRPIRDLTCQLCGAPYQSNTPRSRYCSRRCQWTVTNARRREKKQAQPPVQ